MAYAKHTLKTKEEEKTQQVLEHFALLIMVLQTMSSILTFLLGDHHKFFTQTRDIGLDAYHLSRDLPMDLVNEAQDPKNQTKDFWWSETIELQYWPLQLRCMLEGNGGIGTDLSAQELALNLKYKTVRPVAKKLLAQINSVYHCSPTVRSYNVVSALRLRLHAFAGKKVERDADIDLDPQNTIARGLHTRHFAGHVGNFTPENQHVFNSVILNIRRKYGAMIANTIEMAAVKAGLQSSQQYESLGAVAPLHKPVSASVTAFLTTTPRDSKEDSISTVKSNISSESISTLGSTAGDVEISNAKTDDGEKEDDASVTSTPETADCGRLLLTQFPLMKQLDDLLYLLSFVDEDKLMNEIGGEEGGSI
jgi:hypothetical protein